MRLHVPALSRRRVAKWGLISRAKMNHTSLQSCLCSFQPLSGSLPFPSLQCAPPSAYTLIMASSSIRSVTQQFAGLDISKQPKTTSTSTSKPTLTKQPSQTNVTKLLTKFAAPNPYNPAAQSKSHQPSSSSSSLRNLTNTTSETKIAALSETTKDKDATAPAGLDIGRYDGGIEIDNEKRGEKVYGEAAEDLALDSSVSRYAPPSPSSIRANRYYVESAQLVNGI